MRRAGLSAEAETLAKILSNIYGCKTYNISTCVNVTFTLSMKQYKPRQRDHLH